MKLLLQRAYEAVQAMKRAPEPPQYPEWTPDEIARLDAVLERYYPSAPQSAESNNNRSSSSEGGTAGSTKEARGSGLALGD